MPIYEFLCTDKNCNHKTESIFWIQENIPPMVCEKCGKEATRVLSLVSNLFQKRYEGPCFTGSYSEKQQWMKENNLKEAGDALGGSKETSLSDHYKKSVEQHKEKANKSFEKSFSKAVEKTAKDF